uniref:Zinc finger, GRF-type n=1 Tax=Tanacetum cinerariifolium TaxID=118510 RepID=A0A6L2KJS5_TANCI|nr:zinc finger, GRF-type [Tanacetum cinerariifolium]
MATCFCGRRENIITAWTNQNPGRHFHGCLVHGIVDWIDPPTCQRAVNIISGLLMARNRQEAQLLEAQRGHQRMKKLLILSRELYEEEMWGSFCRGSCFQICDRMRHRDVVIENSMA